MEKEYRNKEILDYVDQIAKEILKDEKNGKREVFFPSLIESLGLKTAVEIGVDKGDFSKVLLDNTSIEKLYCVDTWCNLFGSDHRKNYFDPDGDVRLRQAYEKLKNHIDGGRAELVRCTGLESSKFLPDDIDYIFIDGDHSLEGVYEDIYSWVPKIKLGGIVSGHDYKNGRNSGMKDYWGNQMDYAVQYVVDYYCGRYGYKVSPVGPRVPSWWFVKI